MKQKNYVISNFLKFLLEKYDQDEEETIEVKKDKKVNPPYPPAQEEEEDEDDIEEIDDENADEIIERLLSEYKKVKKQYESRKIYNRRKR